MKDKNHQLTDDSDEQLLETLRLSYDASDAFLSIGIWGRERFKESIHSRGDCFDRCGAVVFERNEQEVLRIPVASLPATIGSSRKADFVLNEEGVSRLHCHLEPVGSLVRICDNDSTNGLKLNHKKIDQEDLCDGDELKLGSATFIVRKL